MQDQTTSTTALAQTPAPKTSAKLALQNGDLKSLINSDIYRMQFAAALPKHLTADRFMRVATTALTRNPKLVECTPASFMRCLLDLSALGIEPDGRRAHLIPFNEKYKDGNGREAWRVACQLIIDWKGKAELAMRSGQVSNLHVDIVCENDLFRYNRGVLEQHEIDFRKPRGPMYAAYSLCRFKDGTESCDVMSRADVEKIRDRSKGYQDALKYKKSNPWMTDFDEMAKKTVFHRHSKRLPLSAEFRDSIELDDKAQPPLAGAASTGFIDIPADDVPGLEDSGASEGQAAPETSGGASAPAGAASASPASAAANEEIPASEKLFVLIEEAGWSQAEAESALQHLKLHSNGLATIPDRKAAQIIAEWPAVSGTMAHFINNARQAQTGEASK